MALLSHALTTVARIRDYLGTTLTSTEITVMENIINVATGFIENYTGRRFKKTSYSNQNLHSDGSERLFLENFPVISSETFTLQYREGVESDDDFETVDAEDYHVDYDTGIVYSSGRYDFTKGYFTFRASYTAGYDFDNSTTFLGDTAAGDVEFAAWKIGALMWHTRRGDPTVKSERIGDYSITYGGTGDNTFLIGLGADKTQVGLITSILDRYIRADDSIVGTITSDYVT